MKFFINKFKKRKTFEATQKSRPASYLQKSQKVRHLLSDNYKTRGATNCAFITFRSGHNIY